MTKQEIITKRFNRTGRTMPCLDFVFYLLFLFSGTYNRQVPAGSALIRYILLPRQAIAGLLEFVHSETIKGCLQAVSYSAEP